MSKDVGDTGDSKATETPQEATKPVADAKVVQDTPRTQADEEKAHDDLVKDVAKRLGQTDSGDPVDHPKDSPEPEAPGDVIRRESKPSEEPPKGEGDEEKTAKISKDLQTRATKAGLTEDMAERLHQSGQLEETLAAFDRGMIEYVQSKEPSEGAREDSKEAPKDEGKKEPPPKDPEVPALDPEIYDEELVKRDAYQQKRIDTLESELAEVHSQLQEIIEGQQGGFDEWFDGILDGLGCDTKDDDKCQSVFKAYGAMCAAFGANVHSRDKAMVERAYAAMYPQDVFKQKQRQTVNRLRDAEGKFLSSPTTRGGPPPKGATDEEVNDQLVSNVTAYLKERGVQMSGI